MRFQVAATYGAAAVVITAGIFGGIALHNATQPRTVEHFVIHDQPGFASESPTSPAALATATTISETDAAAALAAQQAAAAAQAAADAAAAQAAADAAAKAAATKKTTTRAKTQASTTTGNKLPSGSPVPLVQDPGGAQFYDTSLCASGSASTVNGVPTCD
jgi:predicted lipid-binding transport protein (Tim44 family)